MKFAKGDRVICTEDYDGAATMGMTGTVIYHYNFVSIEFDREVVDRDGGYVCGHCGYGGSGKNGFCWDIISDFIQPYIDLPTVVCGDMSMLFGATGGI